MSKIRVHCFGISLDGFGAGPNQDLDHPLGVKGMDLMQLIDEMHLAASPTLLGTGERLLEGIDLLKLGYKCIEHAASPAAMHVVLAK